MTDERIKEEFDRFHSESHDYKDICKDYGQGDKALQAMAFFEGFRTSERLAKIEVLEKVIEDYGFDIGGLAYNAIRTMLSELKEIQG